MLCPGKTGWLKAGFGYHLGHLHPEVLSGYFEDVRGEAILVCPLRRDKNAKELRGEEVGPPAIPDEAQQKIQLLEAQVSQLQTEVGRLRA